jgi:hypothetical protein
MNFAKQLKELQTKVDDTFLPCAIYCAKSGNLQDSLLRDFNPEKHTSHFTSSEKCWTNDKLGFKWLEKMSPVMYALCISLQLTLRRSHMCCGQVMERIAIPLHRGIGRQRKFSVAVMTGGFYGLMATAVISLTSSRRIHVTAGTRIE